MFTPTVCQRVGGPFDAFNERCLVTRLLRYFGFLIIVNIIFNMVQWIFFSANYSSELYALELITDLFILSCVLFLPGIRLLLKLLFLHCSLLIANTCLMIHLLIWRMFLISPQTCCKISVTHSNVTIQYFLLWHLGALICGHQISTHLVVVWYSTILQQTNKIYYFYVKMKNSNINSAAMMRANIFNYELVIQLTYYYGLYCYSIHFHWPRQLFIFHF